MLPGRDAVERIGALLPQTQCRQCGFAGCEPYAEAIASGEADIDRCPPGGAAGIVKLASLLGREVKPVNPLNGVEAPLQLASIEEEHCIGCTLCIQACPVDAIVGAPKQMHTVFADRCTGCKLCLPPCPVDCIRMDTAPFVWSQPLAAAARRRFDARKLRLGSEKSGRFASPEARGAAAAGVSGPGKADHTPSAPDLSGALKRKKIIIDAAIARARELRSQRVA